MNAENIKTRLKDLEEKKVCKPRDVGKVALPLLMLSGAIQSRVSRALEETYSMTYSELDVMVSLKLSPDKTLSPTDLYVNMLFSSGGMTKILKKLESKAYIRRLDNPHDKRSKLVQLTDAGSDLATTMLNHVIDVEEEILGHLGAEKRGAFITPVQSHEKH